MTVYAQICTKKSSKWSKYSKLCIVGIQIRKYILRWTCVYRINFKIRNSKIQANYTAKVKIVRESPVYENGLYHDAYEYVCRIWSKMSRVTQKGPMGVIMIKLLLASGFLFIYLYCASKAARKLRNKILAANI